MKLRKTALITVAVMMAASTGAGGSCAHRDRSAEATVSPRAELAPPAETKPDCRNSEKAKQAGDVIEEFDRFTYRGYTIQTRYRMARVDEPRDYHAVEVAYVVVRRKGKLIAKFDSDIFSPLGNSAEAGLLSLLKSDSAQLIVSQDISRTGVQWVADFSNGFKVIFDGHKFNVGRESYDMTISDLDGDGIYEITVPITAFYGFEGWRLYTADTPLPDIVFKYYPQEREYLPANPLFKDCLLQNIEAEENYARSVNQQTNLGSLMSVVLDYVFAGEEQRGWKFFDETCTLPDKDRIRADMQKEINHHPVYRFLQRARRTRAAQPRT